MNRARVASLIGLVSFVVLVLAAPAPVLAGAPLQLTETPESESGTDAFVDAAGNIHVVYERMGGIYYRAKTGEGWTAEEQVVTAGMTPAVGAGASGVPQVVFRTGTDRAMYTARSNGSWLEPVDIGSAYVVDMAVDPAGVAHVVCLGNYDGDGYEELVYTNNAPSGAFPGTPLRMWDGYYWYEGGGKDAKYYSGPAVAVDAAGNVAVAFQIHAIQGAIGWTDHSYALHVYFPGTDSDVSSPVQSGWYSNPQRNALAVADADTAYMVYGRTVAVVDGPTWSTFDLPLGSGHSIDLSPNALHAAYVDPTGAISYVEVGEEGPGTPVVIAATTFGRTPIVRAPASGAIVVFEAPYGSGYEVWLAKMVNEAPVLQAIGDLTVDEGEVLSFTIAATDEDDDPLTYEAGNLPEGSTFDTDTQTFTWTPDYDQAGAHADIEFSVSDGTDTDSETITITVNDVNAPPVIDTIGNQSVKEGQTLSFTVVATDPDGNGLTYEASGLPDGASFDPGTQVFSWSPGYDDAGTYANVVFSVTDDGEPNLGDTETITITVDDVNREPVLAAIGNKSVSEGGSLSFTVSATDEDGDALTYSVSGLPKDASFDADAQAFTWSPGYSQSGIYDVTFSVTDGKDSVDEAMTITVDNVNRAPVLGAVGDKSVDEGGSLSFTVSATDLDDDELKLDATGLPSGASFDAGSFSWSPGYADSGTYEVTFTVVDEEDSDSETVTITVNNVNRAPVLGAIGDRSVNEGEALSFTVSATDADGETLTYEATGLPAGATFDTGTGAFSWTPGYAQAGSHSVTFSVTDGEDTDSETIEITVSDVNRAPELGAIGDQTVSEGSSLSFTVSATDADGDTLTYSASGLPAGASFDPATRAFSWTPAYDQSGTYSPVTFSVTDGKDTDGEKITVTVTDLNRAPVLAALGNKLVKAESTLTFTVSATDADGDGLTYSASNLPSGATFDPATRTFSWTPAKTQSGRHSGIVFTVTDDGAPNASDTETIAVTVGGVAVDFDADGRADLLWHNPSTGQLYAWLMNGRVRASATFLTPASVATAWLVRGIADLDGDGRSDVLFHNQVTGDLYAWFMDGVTRKGAGTYLTPAAVNPALWQVQGLADFDGDGKADVLWRHQATGELYVWLMDGTNRSSGVFLTPAAVPDASWQVGGLADFDGDGKTDILWHHQATGQVYLWRMNGTVRASAGFLAPASVPDTSWKIGQVADFDGDGKTDILWHNQSTGQLYVWTMDGATRSSADYTTPGAVGADWRLARR